MYKVNCGQAPKYISDLVSAVAAHSNTIWLALCQNYQLSSTKALNQVRLASILVLRTCSVEQAPTRTNEPCTH